MKYTLMELKDKLDALDFLQPTTRGYRYFSYNVIDYKYTLIVHEIIDTREIFMFWKEYLPEVAGVSVSLEDVLNNVAMDVKEKMLFHLDLFS